MDRTCENCRFCIYARSMRGKEAAYCERHSKWIGDTLLCSEWKMASVPKRQTNADHIRTMTDEEIENWYWWMRKEMVQYTDSRIFVHDWLKAPVEVQDD